MAKISAEQFSREGDKYLGRSYDEMDCQEFVERAMKDAGLKMNLAGSNAWYREVMKNGWVGSPEECRARFGSVPTGALLFIHAYDGGEEKRGYHDGLGNAKHIGIVTHRNDGAIHSSSSREMVCTSKFADKTIKNGGWNTIGLYNKFTYGEAIDRILNGSGEEPDDPDVPGGGGETPMTGTIWTPNGGPVNFRRGPSTKDKLIGRIPFGNEIEIIEIVDKGGEHWIAGSAKDEEGINRTGYVMAEYVSYDGEPEPIDDGSDAITVTLTMTANEAAALLPVLNKLVSEIADKAGRG